MDKVRCEVDPQNDVRVDRRICRVILIDLMVDKTSYVDGGVELDKRGF